MGLPRQQRVTEAHAQPSVPSTALLSPLNSRGQAEAQARMGSEAPALLSSSPGMSHAAVAGGTQGQEQGLSQAAMQAAGETLGAATQPLLGEGP